MIMEATLHPVCKYSSSSSSSKAHHHAISILSFPSRSTPSRRPQGGRESKKKPDSRPDDNPMAVAFCHPCVCPSTLSHPLSPIAPATAIAPASA
ncbi:hypothetical protein CKAH01_10969 [Colletotrichum kahawae]|uniref:Uncharacterized protein n=1 Tax=Colletotrichum kahawae TaxID=34407 RepID=A0AAD9XXD1_COLKA|nr:hypothetical protein CKAH01_10969 [Colletotrichum kahawae]